METKQLAHISTLLDEAVEELDNGPKIFSLELRNAQVRSIAKIREAQAILLGEKPTVPEDN